MGAVVDGAVVVASEGAVVVVGSDGAVVVASEDVVVVVDSNGAVVVASEDAVVVGGSNGAVMAGSDGTMVAGSEGVTVVGSGGASVTAGPGGLLRQTGDRCPAVCGRSCAARASIALRAFMQQPCHAARRAPERTAQESTPHDKQRGCIDHDGGVMHGAVCSTVRHTLARCTCVARQGGGRLVRQARSDAGGWRGSLLQLVDVHGCAWGNCRSFGRN